MNPRAKLIARRHHDKASNWDKEHPKGGSQKTQGEHSKRNEQNFFGQRNLKHPECWYQEETLD